MQGQGSHSLENGSLLSRVSTIRLIWSGSTRCWRWSADSVRWKLDWLSSNCQASLLQSSEAHSTFASSAADWSTPTTPPSEPSRVAAAVAVEWWQKHFLDHPAFPVPSSPFLSMLLLFSPFWYWNHWSDWFALNMWDCFHQASAWEVLHADLERAHHSSCHSYSPSVVSRSCFAGQLERIQTRLSSLCASCCNCCSCNRRYRLLSSGIGRWCAALKSVVVIMPTEAVGYWSLSSARHTQRRRSPGPIHQAPSLFSSRQAACFYTTWYSQLLQS